jgi:hypothetical protein
MGSGKLEEVDHFIGNGLTRLTGSKEVNNMNTKRRWIPGILILCGLLWPTANALADCHITTTSAGNDTVICSNPADTNGINTGSGNDTLTVNADTSVSSGTGVTAINMGSGTDTVYQRGRITAGGDAINMGGGNNEVLNNYGTVTAQDDGFWCTIASGQLCTINNYGPVTSVNENIDISNNGGRLVLRNTSTITSTAQEAVHLHGPGTAEITNDGTLKTSSRQVIEVYQGTLILTNNGTIQNTGGNYAAVQCYTASDRITNRGTIIATGPAIYTYAGNDIISHLGGSMSGKNTASNRGVIEGGSGNDTITVNANLTETGSGGAVIEAGPGSDSVIIQGGTFNKVIDGDEIGYNGDYDTLTFRFTGTQTEINAFRTAMNGKSPSGGSVVWRGKTYSWTGFEKIVLELTVG